MPAGCNLFQNLRNGGTWSSRNDCRGGTDMHQIDHRDRCVRLGKCRDDRRKCAWPKTRTAELGWQRQPKKPDSPEYIDSLGREPTLFIVLSGGWGQYPIGYLSCLRKGCFMIHGVSVLDCVAG